jgi:hypothetical protein
MPLKIVQYDDPYRDDKDLIVSANKISGGTSARKRLLTISDSPSKEAQLDKKDESEDEVDIEKRMMETAIHQLGKNKQLDRGKATFDVSLIPGVRGVLNR